MAEHANDDHHVALSYAEAYNGNEPRPGDRVSDADVATTAPGSFFFGNVRRSFRIMDLVLSFDLGVEPTQYSSLRVHIPLCL